MAMPTASSCMKPKKVNSAPTVAWAPARKTFVDHKGGTVARLLDHRLPAQAVEDIDDVVTWLAAHENAPHRPGCANSPARRVAGRIDPVDGLLGCGSPTARGGAPPRAPHGRVQPGGER